MDEPEQKVKRPSYAELATENQALHGRLAAARNRIRSLEAMIRSRDAEASRNRRRAERRVLDADAADPFDRPWDGR